MKTNIFFQYKARELVENITYKFLNKTPQKIYAGLTPGYKDDSNNFNAYLDMLKAIESPDSFIIITTLEENSEDGHIFTINPDALSIYNSIILSDDVFVSERILDDETLGIIDEIKQRFPKAKVVPIKIDINIEPIEIYHFGRFLTRVVNSTNRKVFVLGMTDWSRTQNYHVKELQNAMTQRVINNFEISRVNKLAVENPSIIKILLYYLHYNDINTPMFAEADNEEYIYFKSEEEEPEKLKRITLLGFGDVMLDRGVRSHMNRSRMFYPFELIAGEGNNFMEGTDFIFANLEGPIKEVYIPTSKSIAFRFMPDIVDVLKNAGITIVSIANNHALDQGWGGRSDTMKFLKEGGIAYFGHPKNSREDNIYTTTIAGTEVAFVGFDDTIFKIDYAEASSYINELNEDYDYVIVSVHWGREYVHQPTQRKVELAHMFVDSGADLVIGHHPHVVQTMEIYNDVAIFYSLGNFVFDQYFSLDTQEGLSIGVILEDEKTVLYLFPYSIPHSQPVLMNSKEKAAFLDKFISWGDYNEELIEDIKSGKIMLHHY